MNKILCLFFALCCFCACQKHTINPSDSTFFISIDSSVGSVALNHSGDTFLVRLNEPWMISALPLAYHLSPGATASSGARPQGISWPGTDNIWKDTVDLTPNTVHVVTVTSENGKTRQYPIAFQYTVLRRNLPMEFSKDDVKSIFFDGDMIYVTTIDGLLMSVDDGLSFGNYRVYRPNDGYGPNVNCVYARGKTIYAGINDGLAMSSDGGQTFTTHVYKSAGGYGFGVSGIAVQGDTIYCASGNGMLISRDGGASFDTTTNGLITPGNPIPAMWCVYASGSTVYAGGQSGLFISHDGGRSFNLISLGGAYTTRVNSIYVRNGWLYVATIFGFSVSPDGGNTFYNFGSNGLPGASQVSGYGNTVAVAIGKLGVSTDKGQSYATYSGEIGLGNIVTAVTMNGDVIYAGTQGFISVMKARQ